MLASPVTWPPRWSPRRMPPGCTMPWAWPHAGHRSEASRAKQALLRWRLHSLLAELTGDLLHGCQAALARPDLPTSRRWLGMALAQAGRPAEAVPHLRQAVAENPLDAE